MILRYSAEQYRVDRIIKNLDSNKAHAHDMMLKLWESIFKPSDLVLEKACSGP